MCIILQVHIRRDTKLWDSSSCEVFGAAVSQGINIRRDKKVGEKKKKKKKKLVKKKKKKKKTRAKANKEPQGEVLR